MINEQIAQLLLEKNWTIGTAESCTGGYLAYQITKIAGSSRYFSGSIIAYANAVKINLLHVNPKTLEQFGAVSEATVKEMVQGALLQMNVDMAIATSGIAGPGGGTADKPVGTIWMAVGTKEKTITKCLHLDGGRLENIEETAVCALGLAAGFILEY